MILSDIKEYLVKHKRVILGGLAVHFGTEPEAMKGMLDLWIRKGRVVKSDARRAAPEAAENARGGSHGNIRVEVLIPPFDGP
jgi:hypothetical protein